MLQRAHCRLIERTVGNGPPCVFAAGRQGELGRHQMCSELAPHFSFCGDRLAAAECVHLPVGKQQQWIGVAERPGASRTQGFARLSAVGDAAVQGVNAQAGARHRFVAHVGGREVAVARMGFLADSCGKQMVPTVEHSEGERAI